MCNSQDMNQNSGMGCGHSKLWLNPLCHQNAHPSTSLFATKHHLAFIPAIACYTQRTEHTGALDVAEASELVYSFPSGVTKW